MSALRKPGVAAMIMLVCIVIALVIGRAGGISEDNTSSEPGWEETINSVVNNYSTVGTIQEALRQVRTEKEMVDSGEIVVEEKNTNKRTTISSIIIVLGIILVLRGLAGKK